MNMRALRSYQAVQAETSVAAASPVDLVRMVYDRVLDHLRLAEDALRQGHDCGESVSRASDLITQGLVASLDAERGGEIAQNLGALYTWSLQHLLTARLRREPAMIREVIAVLEPLRDAWASLSGKALEAA